MAENQKEAFLEVYNIQKGRCFITGKYIPLDKVTAHCFPHILPKGMYKKYKFDTRNIVFVDCSNPFDVGLHKKIDSVVNGRKGEINQILEEGDNPKEFLKDLLISI